MLEYFPFYKTKMNLSLIKGLDGWLSNKEASLLYRLARRSKGKGEIVEIGSWKGKSTICLSCGSRDGAGTKVTAIDPHTGSSEHGDVYTFDEFKENIKKAGVEDMVNPIVKTSEDASVGCDKPVELLWIDGAHEEEFVRLDFEKWNPHLIKGGTIAFHDSSMPGVKVVLEEKLYRGKGFKKIRFVHGATYAVKGRPMLFANRFMMVMRNFTYYIWKIKHFFRHRKHQKTQTPG